MNSELSREKLKLEQRKQKILLKEKLLKEREKKRRTKQFHEIGQLAYKADIDQIDKNILLGAFLSISQKLKDENCIEQWKSEANKFLSNQKMSDSPIAIMFKVDPPKAIKDKLKEMNFKWNRFRKEFYGYANKTALEDLLKDTNFQLSEIPA